MKKNFDVNIPDMDVSLREEHLRINNKTIRYAYDYEVLGDETKQLLIPSNWSLTLKKRLLTALLAEKLDLNSLDYTYKNYSYLLKINNTKCDKNIVTVKIFDFVSAYVNEYLDFLTSIDKVNTTGLIVSRSALYRMLNTFKSILMLLSRDLFTEAMNLCRVILEQCAWCYSIHTINNEDELFKINPTNCITAFKKFYSIAGSINGLLSKCVHISPELTVNYIKIYRNYHAISFNPLIDRLDSFYCILQLTDMYCSTIEYIFRNFINEFKFIHCIENTYILNKERNYVVEANNLLDEFHKVFNSNA